MEEFKPRKLSELSLIDDYLFGLFIQDAGSKEYIRRMLEIMLGIKIISIEFAENQHNILNGEDKHGIRLDAFVKDENGVLYNIEVQTANRGDLPKRVRFYQALIDREQIPAGEYDYSILPKTIIIFVTDFDLFGKGLYRYTFRNICIEDSSVALGDETVKVFLNTKGKRPEGVDPELIELLRYFRSSDDETAGSSSSKFVKELNGLLVPIKNDPDFGGDFMSYEEALYTKKKEGLEIGIKELIGAYFEFGKTKEEAISGVEKRFSLTRKAAEDYVNKYCEAN